MNYQLSGFEPFEMDKPNSIGGLGHTMFQAAKIANEKDCVILVGVRPLSKRWKDAIPLVFSPGNISEAMKVIKDTLGQIRNRFFLVGDYFPEVEIYLLNKNYIGNLICAYEWDREMTEPMRCTISNLQCLVIESGEAKRY